MPSAQPSPAELMLRIALVPILTGWAKVCPRANSTDSVDADTVEIYAEALAGIRITVPELEDARRSMLRSQKFFPTVNEIVEFVEDSRTANGFAGYVDVIGPDGLSYVAPPERALNGRLVAADGNGVPAAAMEEYRDIVERIEDRRQALGTRSLALLDDPEAMRMPALGGRNREPISPEKEAELIAEAIRTRERNAGGSQIHHDFADDTREEQ